MGRPITAIVAISSSGRKAPPFFILAGKRVMYKWFDPVRGKVRSNHPYVNRFTNEGSKWFPGEVSSK